MTDKENRYDRSLPKGSIRTGLRGSVHNVIVVKTPNNYFTEALFLLKDDFDIRNRDLLKEAKEAAGCYTAPSLPAFELKTVIIIVQSIIVAVETVILLLINR